MVQDLSLSKNSTNKRSILPLQLLDFIVFGCYFLAVAIIAIYASRGLKTGSDLFLAGRSLGFVTVGLALFASNISSTTLIGLMGEAYRSGISVANFEWMSGLVLIILRFFCLPSFFTHWGVDHSRISGRSFQRKYSSLLLSNYHRH